MIAPIISVTNVDLSVAFYTETLGFGHDFSMPGPDGKNVFAFVHLGDNAIGLSLAENDGKRGAGVDFMIYVPGDKDIDKRYEETKSKGQEITSDIKTEYWGDRVFTLHDRDGYSLTFAKTVKQVPMEEIQAHMTNQ